MNNFLVIVPARGGSKGVPQKNIKLLAGSPLIQYTIDAARQVFRDDQIIVSTDDTEIKGVVENLGLHVPFLRPDQLATDHAASEDVIRHALDFYEKSGHNVEAIVLLQPTSPLRTPMHIRECIKAFDDKCEMLVSVKETRSNPYYLLFEEKDGFLQRSKAGAFTRRQDCPKVWELNGAIYIVNREALRGKNIAEMSRIAKYVMTEQDSVDIDSFYDWQLAEIILGERKNIK